MPVISTLERDLGGHFFNSLVEGGVWGWGKKKKASGRLSILTSVLGRGARVGLRQRWVGDAFYVRLLYTSSAFERGHLTVQEATTVGRNQEMWSKCDLKVQNGMAGRESQN